MKSIRAQLLIGLMCATLACAVVAGRVLYDAVRDEANELSDLQLRQIAAALPQQFAAALELPAAQDPDEDIVIEVWDGQGRLLYASRPQLAMPQYAGAGFHKVRFQAQRWRIYGERGHDRVVQVAQPMAVRQALATEMALRLALPLLAFVVVLGALIYVVVARALRPLDAVAQAVGWRSARALQPLPVDALPPDLLPIVLALNGLLVQIDQALTTQRNFVADAAHELRSPLTALKLQLQLAERAAGTAQREHAFGKLHERLDRATHLVSQLLTLARHEAGGAPQRFAPLDLHLLAQSVVADRSTLADSRAIDLGVLADSQPLTIVGDGEGLRVLLNNLVDNALRYTQPGGQVDLLAAREHGRALLRVIDNGPGVPAHERERVFDRFYRPDGNLDWGCGLGLSIVRNIAQLHGAELRLSDSAGSSGLTVTLIFPAQAGSNVSDAQRPALAS